MIIKNVNPNKVIIMDEKTENKRKLHEKLDAISAKKKSGKLTLDDIYEQNQIIIELLTESQK